MNLPGRDRKHLGGQLNATLLNVFLYQTGWFACVLGGAKGYPWVGAGIGLALLTVHLLLCVEFASEARTVFWIGLAGTVIDSIQAFFGTFVFLSGYWTQWVVPFWLTVMWMQFATLFHFALGWLADRYILASLLGAVGGPAAFLTGERMGAVVFPGGIFHSLLILGAIWAFVLPAAVFIAGHFRPVNGGYMVFSAQGS